MKEVGQALAGDRFLVSWSLAPLALRVAADLTDDADLWREATDVQQRFKSTYAAKSVLRLASEFAIPSLQGEVYESITRDEVGFLRVLSSASTGP